MNQPDSVDDSATQSEAARKRNVESLIEVQEIGNTLKRMRLKRSMGLVGLGNRSGMSASYLSQLETGRVVPTIRNLAQLAAVFNVDLSVFFRDTKPNRFAVSKKQGRIPLPCGAKGSPFMLSESMAALVPGQNIVPCIAELLPGKGEQAFEARPSQGLEFVFVVAGAVRISTRRHSEILERDDVAWLSADVKRSYQCVAEASAQVMIISFPFQA